MGFALALYKPDGFIGCEVAKAQKAAAPYHRRLVQVLVKDPEPLLWHAEVIRRNGVPVGTVRSGSYGHTLGGGVGLAMIEGKEMPVTADYLAKGTWEIDIAGKKYPCECSLHPMYDPKMERIKV